MLIGFSGGMGAGKSTAIQMLGEVSNRPVINVKFAQPLYDMQEYIYERISSVYTRPLSFVKDRKLLQWLGTDWGRETVSKSIWVDLWKAKVQELQAANPTALIVCDDVRFDNEAEILRSVGGKLVRIAADRAESRTVSGIANHASEAGISAQHIDYIVENNGTVEEFKDSMTYLYNRHLVLGVEEADQSA